MHIDYGPPVASGVTQLQYVGDVAGDDRSVFGGLARPVGIAGVVLWLYGEATSSRESKQRARSAFWAALGLYVADRIVR